MQEEEKERRRKRIEVAGGREGGEKVLNRGYRRKRRRGEGTA